MGDLLIPDIKDETIKRLKAQAKQHGWTLKDEICNILKIDVDDIGDITVLPSDDKKRRSR